MLALHLLPAALVHVNTLLTQQVLADLKWADQLTDADRRGLSPLFWTHVNPYGRFELDMNSHLDLTGAAAMLPGPHTAPDTQAPESGPVPWTGVPLRLRERRGSATACAIADRSRRRQCGRQRQPHAPGGVAPYVRSGR